MYARTKRVPEDLAGISPITHGREYTERNATQLAHAGFDTYVLDYYNEQDVACSKTVETRRANFSKRIGAWSQMVSDVVTDVLRKGARRALLGLWASLRGDIWAHPLPARIQESRRWLCITAASQLNNLTRKDVADESLKLWTQKLKEGAGSTELCP